jgi:hypothetical protein
VARHARCSRSGTRGRRATVREPRTRTSARLAPRPRLSGLCVLFAWSSALPVDVRRPSGGRECPSMRYSAHTSRASAHQLPRTARLRAAVGILCLSPSVLLGFDGVTHVGRLGRTSVGAAAGCARHARESSPRHRQPRLGIWLRGAHGAKVSAHTIIDAPGASLCFQSSAGTWTLSRSSTWSASCRQDAAATTAGALYKDLSERLPMTGGANAFKLHRTVSLVSRKFLTASCRVPRDVASRL